MERQKVTLALPKDVLQRARQIAAVRKTSLSALVTNFLVEYREREESYEAARQRAMVAMERGLPFNTDGKITWTRDELHDAEVMQGKALSGANPRVDMTLSFRK